ITATLAARPKENSPAWGLDRAAIAPPLREAIIELALLEHRIGEPDAAAHDAAEDHEQDDVGDAPVARRLDINVVVLRRLRLVGIGHVQTSVAGTAEATAVAWREIDGELPTHAHPAMVSFTLETSCLSVNGLGRNSKACASGRLFSKASS